MRYLHGAYARDSPEFRERFLARQETIRELGARWIANEPAGLIELRGPAPPQPAIGGSFLISLDAEPLAWADSHGAWLRWLG